MAYFPLRMCEKAKFLLLIKNLTPPSCSRTPISYMMQEFWRFRHKYGPHCIVFIAHLLRCSDEEDGSVGGDHSPVYHFPSGTTGYYRFSLLMSQLL